jgi:hypothetical protein
MRFISLHLLSPRLRSAFRLRLMRLASTRTAKARLTVHGVKSRNDRPGNFAIAANLFAFGDYFLR